MSVINQMLRDLDARSHDVSRTAQHAEALPPVRTYRLSVHAAWLVLLPVAALLGYWVTMPAAKLGASPSADAGAGPKPRAVPAAALHPAQAEARGGRLAAAPTALAPTAPASGEARESRRRPDAAAAFVRVPPPVPAVQASPAALEKRPLALSRAQTLGPAPPQTAQAGRAFVVSVASPQDEPSSSGPGMAEPAVFKRTGEPSPESEAQQAYEEAESLRRAGKTDAALARYRQALERDPGMKPARQQAARLLQEGGQQEAASSLLQGGYALRPDPGLAIAAGRLLADLGRREEALLWLERGKAGLRPADHALMGALLSQLKRHEDAVRAYRRALAADPQQGGWLLGLGLALESQGRTDDAQGVYRQALQWGEFKPDVVRFLRQKTGNAGPSDTQ